MAEAPTFYVVIGENDPGIQDTCPFVQTGKRAPSWPVVFKVNDFRAADVMLSAQDIVDTAGCFGMTVFDAAAWIMGSRAIREISNRNEAAGPYYALISGRGSSIIYTSVEEVLDKVQGYTYASWKRLENFQEALAWMVLRGNHTDQFQWTRKYPDSNYQSVRFEPTQRQSQSPKLGQAYRTSQPQTSSFTTPSKASTSSNISFKATATSSTSPSTYKTPERTRLPRTPNNSAASSVQKIWTHSRTLTGIVDTYSSQPPLDRERPPNFTAAANWYFTAHGYTSSALWAIFDMWAFNRNDESAFANALWDAGLPYTEAEWIASVIFMD